MTSINQAKFLSENYSALHGLKGLPLGLCLLLVSLWANNTYGPTKDFTVPIVFVLGAALLSITIDQYYKRTFGEVKQTLANRRTQWIAVFIFGILAIAAFLVDITLNLSINFYGLLFAAILLIDRPKVTLPLNKFSVTKLILSICIALISISPIYLGASWWNTIGIKSTLLGVTIIASLLFVMEGVIWHTFFIRSLPVVGVKDE